MVPLTRVVRPFIASDLYSVAQTDRKCARGIRRNCPLPDAVVSGGTRKRMHVFRPPKGALIDMNIVFQIKGCAMGQVLYGSATTTEAVRRAIKRSQEA